MIVEFWQTITGKIKKSILKLEWQEYEYIDANRQAS
jgi:hypothetical protein